MGKYSASAHIQWFSFILINTEITDQQALLSDDIPQPKTSLHFDDIPHTNDIPQPKTSWHLQASFPGLQSREWWAIKNTVMS